MSDCFSDCKANICLFNIDGRFFYYNLYFLICNISTAISSINICSIFTYYCIIYIINRKVRGDKSLTVKVFFKTSSVIGTSLNVLISEGAFSSNSGATVSLTRTLTSASSFPFADPRRGKTDQISHFRIVFPKDFLVSFSNAAFISASVLISFTELIRLPR